MGKNTMKPVHPLLSMDGSGKTLAESVQEMINDSQAQPGSEQGCAISSKNKGREWKRFTELLEDYTGVKGQGAAVWIPTEVKKRIEFVRANAKTNIPIRALDNHIIVDQLRLEAFLPDSLDVVKEAHGEISRLRSR